MFYYADKVILFIHNLTQYKQKAALAEIKYLSMKYIS